MCLRSGIAMAVAQAAAVAPVQPLAWELPYASNVALKRKKKKEKEKEKKILNTDRQFLSFSMLWNS